MMKIAFLCFLVLQSRADSYLLKFFHVFLTDLIENRENKNTNINNFTVFIMFVCMYPYNFNVAATCIFWPSVKDRHMQAVATIRL